jgi:hypothetical protein
MNDSIHNKIKASPRDFFLYLGMIASLYVSAVFLLIVVFQAINSLFLDVLEYQGGVDLWTMRTGISALFVSFPIYLILSRLIYKDLIVNLEKKEMWIRRWLIYFTLFLSGITLAINAIVLINIYLQGEFTFRFILKVLSVAIVASAIFRYYLFDLRRDIEKTAMIVRKISWASLVVVVVTIVGGIIIVGTPTSQRIVRLDQQRVMDLVSIENQVLYIYTRDGALPISLDEMRTPGRDYTPPHDPQTGESYEYSIVSADSFELCAMFQGNSAKENDNRGYYSTPYPAYYGDKYYIEGGMDKHQSGRVCFERLIEIRPDYNPVQNTPSAIKPSLND